MIKNFKNFEIFSFFSKIMRKICHEKFDFCRIFIKNSNSAAAAEFKNGVIFHVPYFYQKLGVRTNINYVPSERPPNRYMTLLFRMLVLLLAAFSPLHFN